MADVIKPKPERKQLTMEEIERDYEPTTLTALKKGDYVAYKTKARTWKSKSGDEVEYASKINQGFVSMLPDPDKQQGFRSTGLIYGFKGAKGGAWSQNERFVEKVWKVKDEVFKNRKKANAEKAYKKKTENYNKRKSDEAEEFKSNKKDAQEIEADPELLELAKKARRFRQKQTE